MAPNLAPLELKCDKPDLVPFNTQRKTLGGGSQILIDSEHYVTILRVETITKQQDDIMVEAREYLKYIFTKRDLKPLIVEADAKTHTWDDRCKTYLIPGYNEELINKCKRIKSSRIITSKVMLEMKERGIESLPLNRKILTSMCMYQTRIHLAAMKSDLLEARTKKILMMGAIPVSLDGLVNGGWVISALASSKTTIQASERGLFVFSPALIDSLFERSIDDRQKHITKEELSVIITKHRLKPFFGVRFSIIGHSADEQELVDMMKENGAKYVLQNINQDVEVLLDLQAGQNSIELVTKKGKKPIHRINGPFVRACVQKKRFLSHEFYLNNISAASQSQVYNNFAAPMPPKNLFVEPLVAHHEDLGDESDSKMDVSESIPHMPEKKQSMTEAEFYEAIYNVVVTDCGNLHTQAIPSQIRQIPIRQVRVDPMPEQASQRIIWKEKQ